MRFFRRQVDAGVLVVAGALPEAEDFVQGGHGRVGEEQLPFGVAGEPLAFAQGAPEVQAPAVLPKAHEGPEPVVDLQDAAVEGQPGHAHGQLVQGVGLQGHPGLGQGILRVAPADEHQVEFDLPQGLRGEVRPGQAQFAHFAVGGGDQEKCRFLGLGPGQVLARVAGGRLGHGLAGMADEKIPGLVFRDPQGQLPVLQVPFPLEVPGDDLGRGDLAQARPGQLRGQEVIGLHARQGMLVVVHVHAGFAQAQGGQHGQVAVGAALQELVHLVHREVQAALQQGPEMDHGRGVVLRAQFQLGEAGGQHQALAQGIVVVQMVQFVVGQDAFQVGQGNAPLLQDAGRQVAVVHVPALAFLFKLALDKCRQDRGVLDAFGQGLSGADHGQKRQVLEQGRHVGLVGQVRAHALGQEFGRDGRPDGQPPVGEEIEPPLGEGLLQVLLVGDGQGQLDDFLGAQDGGGPLQAGDLLGRTVIRGIGQLEHRGREHRVHAHDGGDDLEVRACFDRLVQQLQHDRRERGLHALAQCGYDAAHAVPALRYLSR